MEFASHCQQCRQPLASAQIKGRRQFCSKRCKNESQKKKVVLTCSGCHKIFSLLPYLRRKANYCCVKCYRDSTRVKEKRRCKVCQKEFYATGPLIKKGFGIYCSRKCQHAVYERKRTAITCRQCGQIKSLPPSIATQRHSAFCSKKCKDDYSRDYVERICKNCHKTFQLPSWETKKGKGLFCSKRCFLQYKGESSIEKKMRYALQKAHISFLQEVPIGKYRADFLLPQHNVVIECDGDYWHNIPGIGERDKRKNDLLHEFGYTIVRLKENLIRKASSSELSNAIFHIATPPLLTSSRAP